MTNKFKNLTSWSFALGVAALFSGASLRADIIADSSAEFSGTQGQNDWSNGYRNYAADAPENYDPAADFIPFAGGTGAGAWDGISQQWTGGAWDLNTEAAAPWTETGAQDLHPNGPNNGEEHWNIRRWVADELTGTTPIGIAWNTRKGNTGGSGVTGSVFVNGVKLDSAVVTTAAGITRTNFINAAKGAIIDLVLSPVGLNGDRGDGADGSLNWMRIDNTMPAVPRQPDGSIFIPSNAADTDADTLADFWENVFFPDNLAAMTGSGDNDSDGLTNKQEQDGGLDPTKADTDGDGLADGVETNTGTFLNAGNTGTNPKVADTDRDGRADGAEVSGTPTSNPTVADTDGDGYSDGSEVTSGHNPNDLNNNPDTSWIAHSEQEFSGVQGQLDWSSGYRLVTTPAAIADYTPTDVTLFPGGEGLGDWDGVSQFWTGSIWDMNTAAAGPWTELGPLGSHPSGDNPIHWVVRRWEAKELTKVTPLALRYHVRKANAGCGNGVTAGVFINGKLGDSVTIAFNNATGTTRTLFANVAPNDIIDVVLSPRGADNGNADGCDGSNFSLVVDSVLPPEPRQPNGSLFIPAGASDTDGDGMPDSWERLYAANLTTFTQTGDFDSDGLIDSDEFKRDSDPTKGDTDGDGLGDKVETGTGTFVSATNTGSSPKLVDTDGDTLSDAAEVNGSPATNPNKGDSDGDSFSDADELASKTDPNNAGDNVLTFVIANSTAEFSGAQGQSGWSNGYRIYTDGEPNDFDPVTGFTAFAGGEGQGPWDGFSQTWTGNAWDLNTEAAAPWTYQDAQGLHPNGPNSGEEHWSIRRWVASEVTQTTPVGLIWNVRKAGAADDGVTGLLYVNGVLVDSRVVPGSDTVGQTRRFYVNLKAGDIVDLAVSPRGVNTSNDFSDSSLSWFWVDTRIPGEARQPDGSLFVPAGASDTDGDGLLDFWERAYAPDLTTLTGTGDNDADGLTNSAEYTLDSNPVDADTDDDGLNDSVETKTGTFVSATNTGTNPRMADTDGDGLSDSSEINGAIKTNPNKADTDDDTFSDSSELASGHNPNDGGHNPLTTGVANSITEFSGTQGQNGWTYGYRNFSADGGGDDYDPTTEFIIFAGGEAGGDWDGVTQIWAGGMWDLNTAGAAPWTELGAQNSHPNGPGPVHWTVRRWSASELTEAKPLAIRYHVHKANVGGGNGVTAGLHINGVRVDSIVIAGNDGVGATHTFYAVVKPTDVIDLIHSPVGADGSQGDGADGSTLWMVVDSVIPPNATQPDGTPFDPNGGGGGFEITSVDVDGANVVLRWESVAGATYRIEGSSNLTAWSPLKTAHPSSGTETAYTTPVNGPHMFYRVARE